MASGDSNSPIPRILLPIIILSQFAGTSPWFAGNAILPELQLAFGLEEGALGYLTGAVQLGFIMGTLAFALLMIADRFHPSKVFWASAWLAAIFNIGLAFGEHNLTSVLLLRFGTGFFLAGIYPVGMKIASDWYGSRLGVALGFLVGALVLGTAFPHWLRFQARDLNWQRVIFITSALAATGGLLVGLGIGEGPNRKKGTRFQPSAITALVKTPRLRQAAIGYFGHMWELYAFWAFIPVFLVQYEARHGVVLESSLWSFAVIAIGGLGCALGGLLALRIGSKAVAFWALLTSGAFCLISPLVAGLSPGGLLASLMIWGIAVTMDSPQFSTLVAQSAPGSYVGTALTLVNSIGFALTIVSIQLLNSIGGEEWMFVLLAPGPIIGLLALRRPRD